MEQVGEQGYENGTRGYGVWSGKSKRGEGKMKSGKGAPRLLAKRMDFQK